MYYTTLPLPKIGDLFLRYREGGSYDEAGIVGLTFHTKDNWQAIVVTPGEGFGHVDGSATRRGFESWFPKGWVYDPLTQSFHPPGTRWDTTTNSYEPIGEGEAESRSLIDPMEGHPVHGLPQVPEPALGEHHAAWLGRVRRTHPEANYDDIRVTQVLAKAWTRWTAKRETAASAMVKSAATQPVAVPPAGQPRPARPPVPSSA